VSLALPPSLSFSLQKFSSFHSLEEYLAPLMLMDPDGREEKHEQLKMKEKKETNWRDLVEGKP
jgi:hypothetical protein